MRIIFKKNKKNSNGGFTPTPTLVLRCFAKIFSKFNLDCKGECACGMAKICQRKTTLKSVMGFTLIELLVTLTIFSITTGIVMFSQNKFDNSVLLTNLAYDVAITIRQAQTYGVNIKEFDNSNIRKFVGYGVYFDLAQSNKQFNLFADTDEDYKFSGSFSCPSGDSECVDKYVFKRGNKIKEICVSDNLKFESNTDCNLGVLRIVFKRPSPEAIIFVGEEIGTANRKSYAKVVVTSADGTAEKNIIINRAGQIYVE